MSGAIVRVSPSAGLATCRAQSIWSWPLYSQSALVAAFSRSCWLGPLPVGVVPWSPVRNCGTGPLATRVAAAAPGAGAGKWTVARASMDASVWSPGATPFLARMYERTSRYEVSDRLAAAGRGIVVLRT